MGHFVYARPSGVWVNGMVPTGTDFTLFDQQIFAAVNGDGGGSWAPSNAIVIGGQGFQLQGTNHQLANNGILTVIKGGQVDVNGSMVFQSDGTPNTGQLTIEGPGQLLIDDGANLEIHDGASMSVDDGAVLLLATSYPSLGVSHPGRTATRLMSLPLYGHASAGMTLVSFYMQGSGASDLLYVAAPRIQGATLVSASLVVGIDSAHTGVPSSLVQFQLLTTGVGALAQFAMSPAVSPSGASLAAYTNGGLRQTLTATCNANNTNLDFDSNAYYAVITDDNDGKHNRFYDVTFQYSAITDMRP